MQAVRIRRNLSSDYVGAKTRRQGRDLSAPAPRLAQQTYAAVESPIARLDLPALTLAGADLLALFLAFAITAWVDPSTSGTFNTVVPGASTSCASVMGYLAYRGHYTRRTPFWIGLRHLAAAGVVAALIFSLTAFSARLFERPLLLPWLLFPACAVVLRYGLRRGLTATGYWQIPTVLVGSSPSVAQAVAALESEPELGYEVVAVLRPEDVGADRAAWRGLLGAHQAQLALLTLDADQPLGREMVGSLVRERIPFAIMPPLAGLPVLGYDQTLFFSHDTVLVSYRNNLAQPVARLIKMGFDVSAAAAGLVIVAPLLLVLAALVKLDGGPVIYGHTRLGAGGRTFRCLKFRSMVVDSDAVLNRLLFSDPAAAAEWRETQKLRKDPRVTAVGRFLRSTSLDELPQLINVLRLEMSLVGPRPIVQAEAVRYGEDIAYYYETRPGLTGLWQVSGRTETSFTRRVELDCWYVKNWTLWHDVAILAKTLPAVLQRRGAC